MALVNKRNGDGIPLVATSIRAKLLDVIGEVEIEQTYINKSNEPIEATYKFPINGNNAVYNFVAKIDGVVIVAKVMEKNKAAAVYDDAISAGKGAYLLEQKEDNTLQISVGNLPPSKEVTLTITYVQELAMVDHESLVLTLSQSLYSALKDSPDVQIDVQMPLEIRSVTTIPATPNFSTHKNTAKIHIPPMPGNKEDITVLVRLGPELGRPRLWIEQWDTSASSFGVDPLAVMLAVAPDVNFQPKTQEIIFLLDRSGSMSGEPTRQLMFTMFHALKFIPSCALFNIVSFGTSHEFLFPESVLPTFENLYAARRLISKLPELGGTELLGPLRDIYSKKSAAKNRHIILLTDGQVYNKKECVDTAKKNRSYASLSTIGIGSVDQNLVKDLAEVGKGKCEIISTENLDNMENIMSNILKWTLDPAFDKVNIIWYDSNGEVCTNVKKAPERLPPIFSGDLYKIYALVPHSGVNLATAQLQATGKAGKINLEINLKSAGTETLIQGKLIHLLAAKQLIREIEEGALRKTMNDTQQKDEVVRLGVAYNLASKHTSFVAVEERTTPVENTMTSVNINQLGGKNVSNFRDVNALYQDISLELSRQNAMLCNIEANVACASAPLSGATFHMQASKQRAKTAKLPILIILAILFFPITLLVILGVLMYNLVVKRRCGF